MNEIWEREPATVKEIVDAVNARRNRSLSRNTILKGMQRLEEKGWLKRKGRKRPAVYVSTEAHERAAADMTTTLKDSLFGGCPVSLVRCLINTSNLSMDEIAELQKMIHAAAEKSKD